MADTPIASQPLATEQPQQKKTFTKEEIKALRLAKGKAMAAAHGTKEANVNSKVVQEQV